jgi:hypothetical protein
MSSASRSARSLRPMRVDDIGMIAQKIEQRRAASYSFQAEPKSRNWRASAVVKTCRFLRSVGRSNSRYRRPGGSEGEAYDVDAARRRLCAAAFRPARPRRSGPALAGSCLVAVSPLAGVIWPVAAGCLTIVASALAATRSTAAVSALAAMMTCLTVTASPLTDRAPRPVA